MKASEVLQRVLKWLGEDSYQKAIQEIEVYGRIRESEGYQIAKDAVSRKVA